MMRRLLSLLPLLACAALTGACGSSTTDLDHPDWSDPAKIDFYSGLDVNLADSAWVKTADGLYYRDLTVGTGAAATVGSTVIAAYQGWLPDGTLFDSNPGYTVTIGTTSVIEGWTEGLQGMKEGGVRKLVIPPALAYGDLGRYPQIPGKTTLVFEITANKVSGP